MQHNIHPHMCCLQLNLWLSRASILLIELVLIKYRQVHDLDVNYILPALVSPTLLPSITQYYFTQSRE